MSIDTYTKTILTVIAVALTVIAGHMTFRGLVGEAQAQMGSGCGSTKGTSCYVRNGEAIGLSVFVQN